MRSLLKRASENPNSEILFNRDSRLGDPEPLCWNDLKFLFDTVFDTLNMLQLGDDTFIEYLIQNNYDLSEHVEVEDKSVMIGVKVLREYRFVDQGMLWAVYQQLDNDYVFVGRIMVIEDESNESLYHRDKAELIRGEQL